MRLLLRCDAGATTGVGHAVRCAALAEAALARGHEVLWSGHLDGLDWLWAGLSRTGWFAYTPLPGAGRTDRPGVLLPPADSAEELAALCRDQRIDAVHVDHYLLGSDLRGPVNGAGVVLSSVEDFHTGRRAADVVVDPNLGSDSTPRPDDGSPVLLRGVAYAPLRAAARRARDRRAASAGPRAGTGPPEVLVVMGGTDAAGLLPGAVRALAATGAPAEVTVVVPPGRTVDLPTGGPTRFRAVAPLSDLPGTAADSDLVVSAAGTTVWELCCVGVPMALVRVADNQAEGYRAVTDAGAAVGLGTAADLGSAAATLRDLLTDPARRAALAARARDVVDGLGAARILTALERAAPVWSCGAPGVPPRPPRARPATVDDADLLLAWRNDPETRRWSRVPDRVEPARHREWLRGSLERTDRMLFVVEDVVGPAGTVRWDLDGDAWEVSITVAPDRRGQGLAAPLLSAGENALRERTGAPTSLRAVVHRENGASVTLFSRAGYRPAGPADDDGFAPHRKDLA